MRRPAVPRRKPRNPWRPPLIAVLLLALATAIGLTAANVVNPSRASDTTTPLSVEPVKPAECDGITTTSTITGTGVITGTDGNDWIIGSDGIDTIDGLGGNDCIEGKGGDDVIDGGVNLDLTPGADVCLGGAGTDTFASCETEVQ